MSIEKQVVFVGGSQRSGTTFIQRLIAESPGFVPVAAECLFVHRFLQVFESVGRNFDDLYADYFRSVGRIEDTCKEVLRVLFRNIIEAHGPDLKLALKFPHMARYFVQLGNWFPLARFVIVIRDPRDVIASMKEVADVQRAGETRSDIAARGGTIAGLCDYLLEFYPYLLPTVRLTEGSYLIIRYEDIVQGDDEQITALARFLGIDGGLSLEKAPGLTHRFLARKSPFFTGLENHDATGSRVGRYAGVLSADEIEEVRRRCAAINEIGGYW